MPEGSLEMETDSGVKFGRLGVTHTFQLRVSCHYCFGTKVVKEWNWVEEIRGADD